MRKVLATLLAAMMLVGIVGCGGSGKTDASKDKGAKAVPSKPESLPVTPPAKPQ